MVGIMINIGKYVLTSIALICSPSHANFINTLTDGKQRAWVDTSSKEGSGSIRRIMELINYKDEQTMGGMRYRSIIYQYQFDCRNKSFKVLMSAGYEKHQGQGRAIFRDDTPTPTYVGARDGSSVYEAMVIACK
jgi:hypothetical protein